MTDFQLYKKIKKRLALDYKGFNLSEIIAIDIIRYAYGRVDVNKLSYKHLFKRFREVPDLTIFKELINFDGTLFTLPDYQAKRKDYLELVDSVKKKVFNSELKLIQIPVKSGKIEWLKCLVLLCQVLLNAFPLLNIKAILYFSTRLFFYQRAIDILVDIEKDQIKVKKYIAFNSSIDSESLLSSFLKKNSIATYSLQHAIYTYALQNTMSLNSKDYPFDIINCENVIADNLLCWSQLTINQLVSNEFNTKKLLLAGSPKYSKIKIPFIKQSFKNCLVFLGGIGHESIDMEVLEIIKKLSLQIDVNIALKLHPQHLNQSTYEKAVMQYNMRIVPQSSTLSSLLSGNEFDFTISYNTTTTTYYEAMCYGLMSFRYARGSLDNNYGLDDDMFSNSEELIQKISYYGRLDQSALLHQVKELLEYVVGINIDNYSKCLS